MTAEERFWKRVDVLGPDDCWQWKGSQSGKGYGTLTDGYRRIRAHRFSYELANGPIPEGDLVCHRCDNMLCVNPNHLFLGTHLDNNLDMLAKSRRSDIKLTPEKAELARSLYKDQNLSPGRIAQQLGVSRTTIRNVLAGRTWRWAEVKGSITQRLTTTEIQVIIDALEFVLAGEFSELWPEENQQCAAESASQKMKDRLYKPGRVK